jgi:hypothetical protein
VFYIQIPGGGPIAHPRSVTSSSKSFVVSELIPNWNVPEDLVCRAKGKIIL